MRECEVTIRMYCVCVKLSNRECNNFESGLRLLHESESG